ncbi:transcription factor DIVARICATA-like [Trifolium pratense]|nr:transcription factor DIVARICATA-like [Trifolium pratense]
MHQKTIDMAAAAARTLWPTQWTREDNKLFEKALITVPENSSNRWEEIAEKIPGKSAAQVKDHYEDLVHDILEIESGRVELPNYPDDLDVNSGSRMSRHGDNEKQKKRKGKPWTEEEHKSFLSGLKEYKEGEWKLISRYYVKTRTPTQVASHAQKYFLRKNEANKHKERKRSSIHDITLEDSNSAPTPIDRNCVLPPSVGSLHQSEGMYYFPSNSMQDQMGSQMH